MPSPSAPGQIARFGVFEADFQARELHKAGIRIKLQDQPLQVLAMLLEHPGELVTRDDIRKRLWPSDTFVDFDHGLNNAVNRLREALGDSAGVPRFIETLPRRGYRFIGTVTGSAKQEGVPVVGGSGTVSLPEVEPRKASTTKTDIRSPGRIAVVAAVSLVLFFAFGLRFLRRGQVTASPIRSLAVLPLENLSGDPSQDYFADGMTDALITDLANISSLRVVSRTSTMHYKGSHQPLPEIARELKVDAVVEGSVIRSGNRVRVNAQLVQASSDRHLWAKVYDRDVREILSVQQDTVQSIVREIQAKLTPNEQSKLLVKAQYVDPEAYSAYLEGRFYLDKRSLNGYNKALALFEHAIETSPKYAPAYAGMAEAYNLLALGMGSISPIEAANRAEVAAQKALELDENLGEAHAARAVTLHRYRWNWAEAEKEYKRAIQLEPNKAIFYTWFSGLLEILGRTEEAQALVHRDRDMDPLSVQGVRAIAGAYADTKQYDKANAYYKKAIASQSDSFRLRMDQATGYLSSGHYPEAVEEFQKVIALYGPNVFPEAELGYTYALWGRKAKAEKILGKLEKDGRAGYVSFAAAKICATLGRKEEALKWLEKAYGERATQMLGVGRDSAFASLHSDSRFQDLVRRVGLPHDIQQ